MRRIAGEVDWLVRSFGVGGFGLRVAGLVLLSRWGKKRSTARQRPRPWVALPFPSSKRMVQLQWCWCCLRQWKCGTVPK